MTVPLHVRTRLSGAAVRAALVPIIGLAVAGAWPATAHAQLGVSDDRVSLPGGPGSLEGVGENVQVAANMGLMRYQVRIDVPEGYSGMTPELALAYSSGSGSSSVGIGWDLAIPTIDRMTWKGLPAYDTGDLFAADGGDQLVEVGRQDGDRVYRARFERAFARYRWVDSGTGRAGYWVAEYPDGRVGYFGADHTGAPVADARLAGDDGRVFRYHLVEMVDPLGHRIHYRYRNWDNVSLIDRIEYVHRDSGAPRFSVAFGYQARQDVVSDAGPGFETTLTQRLVTVDVLSDVTRIRRYQLEYQPYAESGGLSRLSSIRQLGHLDAIHPVHFQLGYSRALGGICSGQDCASPFVVDMGTLPGGADLASGDVTLVDLDGDSLPDVVDTSQPGAHRIVRTILDAEGVSRFDSQIVRSAVGNQGSHRLSAATVQTLDVNGDGFSDLINTITGAVLCNDGSGDWSATSRGPDGRPCSIDASLGDQLQADTEQPGDPDPLHARFIDIDNDKRIDLLRTPSPGVTQVFRNTVDGFVAMTGVEVLGWVFDEDRLFLADMNGDGLLDVARLDSSGRLQYRLHLGFGRWGAIISASGGTVPTSDLPLAQIEDVNGDGLADVLVVRAEEVRHAINRNAGTFAGFESVTAADIQGELPRRDATTTVVVADMNGNGTQDIVWFSAGGRVRFLELFPVRPNLLSRIDNGIGSVQIVAYGTSVGHRARDRQDGVTWKYLLPHAMNVVERVDSFVTLTGGEDGAGLHEITEYRYHDGYYDSGEKRFRGFERAETHLLSDATQEAGLTLSEYDVGVTDVYRNGLLRVESVFGGEGESRRPIQQRLMEYGDCAVAEVPASGLAFPVRSVCLLRERTVEQEGAAVADWAVTETSYTYDGYGNPTRVSNLGVVSRGSPDAPGACGACERGDAFGAPCGATCSGDEAFVETDYVTPGASTGGRWIVGRPFRERHSAALGGESSETTTYYDGPAFVGLSAGQLDRGLVSRIEARVSGGSADTVAVVRNRHDAHGNVVESMDPNGSLAATDRHRRVSEYDGLGLRLRRTEILLTDPDGAPYRLRQELSHDALFTVVSESTELMRVVGGEVVSARNSTFYRYDALGRPARIVRPGDTDSAPSIELVYDIAAPSSQVSARGRSARGGAADLESVTCFDGKGRKFQTRVRLASGRYQVSGFTEFNRRGAAVRVYEPYIESSAACATTPPGPEVASTVIRYDALGRGVETTLPDADEYGTASRTRTVYSPLAVAELDAEDTDPGSPHAGTPVVRRLDGLGRTVAIERHLAAAGAGGEVPTFQIFYDALGNMRGFRDPAGHEKVQRHDLLGRVTEIVDPNAGTTTYQYDAAGNPVVRRDGRGVVTHARFDGANRMVARWDDARRAETEVTLHYDVARTCSARTCTNAEGRLAEALYPVDLGDGITTGRDEYGFDARGRQIHQARVLGGVPFVIEHDYDNADRPVQSRYPGGQTLQRRFDGASRITGFDGLLDAVGYDERDQLERLEYRNGVVSWYEYDQRQRLSRLTTLGGDDQVLQGFEYRRDRAGNVLAIDDLAARRDGHPDATATFGYDAWYRLIDAELAVAQPSQAAAATAVEQLGFRYDSIDNVLSATSSLGVASAAHMGEYAYDGGRPNAVARFGGVDQAHDAAGNVVERGNQTLTWDFAGRLTRVADRSGAAVAHFAYGHDETRVAKKEAGTLTYYIAPEFEVRDGVGVLYAQLGRQRVARLENPGLAIAVLSDLAPLDGGGQGLDGQINAADAWVAHAIVAGIIDGGGAAPSAPMDLLRSSARRLLAELDGGPVFLHADALGSLTLATSSAGAIVGERAFHPFGEARSESGYVDNRGFTGQERDDSTGLLHFQYRYLDPGAGRWASPDPMFATASEAGLSHLGEFSGSYGYVANNPANMVDALGLLGSEGSNGWWKDNRGRVGSVVAAITFTFIAEIVVGAATGGASLVVQAAVATAVVGVVMGINAIAESRGHRWTEAARERGHAADARVEAAGARAEAAVHAQANAVLLRDRNAAYRQIWKLSQKVGDLLRGMRRGSQSGSRTHITGSNRSLASAGSRESGGANRTRGSSGAASVHSK